MPAKHASLAGALLRAAVAFSETLRRAGLPVGLSRTIEFLRALGAIDSSQRQQFYWSASLSL